jgi:hypothetical protein
MALLVVAGEVSPGKKKGATQSDPNKAVAVGGGEPLLSHVILGQPVPERDKRGAHTLATSARKQI